MKLWDKGEPIDDQVEKFTVGNDFLLDEELLPHDLQASSVHAEMLHRIGVLSFGELSAVKWQLKKIGQMAEAGAFKITRQDEDCHTAIENHLAKTCGEAGQKIHTGRSRNDQVLTALRLFEKRACAELTETILAYRAALEKRISETGNMTLPGYTHLRKAMPTDVATWLGSFISSVADDLKLLECAVRIIDQCPLGTAAGFGVPVIEIDREATSRGLEFAKVMENPLYAQLSRGKFEAMLVFVCSQILLGLNKLASDLILFSTDEFGFVQLSDNICTGSSFMPQKKNPDVLELVRAKYHDVLGEEFKIRSMVGNLPSGYNRDLQLTKEPLFKALKTTEDCLAIMTKVVEGIAFDKEACKKALTEEIFATHRALERVKQGVPFREAYRLE